MKEITELLGEARNLEKKLELIDASVKNKETKKLNLEKDINSLEADKTSLEKKVKQLNDIVADAIDKALSIGTRKLQDHQDRVESQLASIANDRNKLAEEISFYKTSNADLTVAIKKNQKEYDVISRTKIEVDTLKSKVLGIIDTVKEALE